MSHHNKILIVLLILPVLWATACSRQGIDLSEIEGSGPTRGEVLFQINPLGKLPGCGTCHSLYPGELMIGPSMADIATVAENKETGLTAEMFVRQAILEPDAYLEPDFNPGAMPRYGKGLTTQDIDDLVAYLLTLK